MLLIDAGRTIMDLWSSTWEGDFSIEIESNSKVFNYIRIESALDLR